MPASHEGCTTRCTNGLHVIISQQNSIIGQSIQIWGRNLTGAMEAYIIPALEDEKAAVRSGTCVESRRRLTKSSARMNTMFGRSAAEHAGSWMVRRAAPRSTKAYWAICGRENINIGKCASRNITDLKSMYIEVTTHRKTTNNEKLNCCSHYQYLYSIFRSKFRFHIMRLRGEKNMRFIWCINALYLQMPHGILCEKEWLEAF